MSLAASPVGVRVLCRWSVALVAVCAGLASYSIVGGRRPRDLVDQNQPPSLAAVRLEPSTLDLGEHNWGTVVPFALRLVNESANTLHVAGLRSSCGCVLVSPESLLGAAVVKGADLVIPLSVRTADTPGEQSANVFLSLTSGETLTCLVKLVSVATYAFDPPQLDFGRSDIREGAERLTMTTNFNSQEVLLQSVSGATEPWLTFDSLRETGKVTAVRVTVDPALLPPGRNVASLELMTTDAGRPKWHIPIVAVGSSPLVPESRFVKLAPKGSVEVSFRRVDGTQPYITEIRIASEKVLGEVVLNSTIRLTSRGEHSSKEPVRIEVVDREGALARLYLIPG